MKKRKRLPPKQTKQGIVLGTLTDLLTTINGFETLENDQLISEARCVLYDFKNYIGGMRCFGENEQLSMLDEAFETAGWDNQGLRWHDADGDGEDICIVEFLDDARTKWMMT